MTSAGKRWRSQIVMLALALAGSAAPAAAAELQRMLLAPAGCFRLAPGAAADAAAYCLDQRRAPPPEGAILAGVPAAFDRTRVGSGGSPPLSLSQALAQRVVRVEGSGDDRHVRLRNLSGHAVEICIGAPTVVMGNGATAAPDLARIRGDIARLLARAPAASDMRARAATQLELWDLVKRAGDEEDAALARELAPAPLPPRPKPAAGGTDRKKCAAGTEGADVRLCIR